MAAVIYCLAEYGKGDQIALNNVLAQHGVLWHAVPESFRLVGDTAFAGELLWRRPPAGTRRPHKFVSTYAKSGVITESEVSARLKIKLLMQHAALRYCHLVSARRGYGGAAEKATDERILPHRAAAVHCYEDTREPSQGVSRMVWKVRVSKQFGVWVVQEDVIRQERALFYPNVTSPGSGSRGGELKRRKARKKAVGTDPRNNFTSVLDISQQTKVAGYKILVKSMLSQSAGVAPAHRFNSSHILRVLRVSELVDMKCTYQPAATVCSPSLGPYGVSNP